MENELLEISQNLEVAHSKAREAEEALHAELHKAPEKVQEAIVGYKESFGFKLGLYRSDFLGKTVDAEVNLLLYGALGAWRGFSKIFHVASEVPSMDELLNLISQVMTLLGVMTIVSMEPTILGSIPELIRGLHKVGRPEEALLLDLEEDICLE
ncbi:hypothetical protein BHE74_00016180 [Ensete ventricosum]|nr:hypothetical protein BHE74_00016180 [Ensete ventricosum]